MKTPQNTENQPLVIPTVSFLGFNKQVIQKRQIQQ